MKREIIKTEDGSHTLYLPEMDEHFHSTHGAIQESMHVFIKNGLARCEKSELVIFEVGFGTGLNAFLTFLKNTNKRIEYLSIEKFPLNEIEYNQLNYPASLAPEHTETFLKMHKSLWDQTIQIENDFHLHKIKGDLADFQLQSLPQFDLVYFDAFAPGKQPEMWNEAILKKIADHTNPKGVFTTYTAKGDVRRTLIKHGFNMQKTPGPPGKKEILFGVKA